MSSPTVSIPLTSSQDSLSILTTTCMDNSIVVTTSLVSILTTTSLGVSILTTTSLDSRSILTTTSLDSSTPTTTYSLFSSILIIPSQGSSIPLTHRLSRRTHLTAKLTRDNITPLAPRSIIITHLPPRLDLSMPW